MSIYLAVFLWACAVVAVLLVIGGLTYLRRDKPEPQTQPIPLAQRPQCDGAHCWRRGTIPATNNDGTPGNYCPGCHRLHTFMGWIVPDLNVTLKAIAACVVCGTRTAVPCNDLAQVTAVLNNGGVTCATCQDVLDAAEQEFTA